MKFHKKRLLILASLSLALITGCQTPSNTIHLTTPYPNTGQGVSNQNISVNLVIEDLRPSKEVSIYKHNGKNIYLNASPDVTQLLQQTMQYNLNSKGLTLSQNMANVNAVVKINKFFATVGQGNLRYKITGNIEVETIIQGAKGSFTKNFKTSQSYDGAFNASNKEIQNVLTQTYNELAQTIYNDNEISQAIHHLK